MPAGVADWSSVVRCIKETQTIALVLNVGGEFGHTKVLEMFSFIPNQIIKGLNYTDDCVVAMFNPSRD